MRLNHINGSKEEKKKKKSVLAAHKTFSTTNNFFFRYFSSPDPKRHTPSTALWRLGHRFCALCNSRSVQIKTLTNAGHKFYHLKCFHLGTPAHQHYLHDRISFIKCLHAWPILMVSAVYGLGWTDRGMCLLFVSLTLTLQRSFHFSISFFFF